MSYLIVEDFKFGLDARRSFLNAVPGSLTKLENGHITQGGEAEKRKAFVGISGLQSTSQLPSGCFGLQSTTAGLLTFGSIATPAGIPAGITYQRLIHPDGATAMASIVHSTAFAGLAYVLAKYTDGNTYLYYNGSILRDQIDGLVLTSLNTNVKIATALTAAINRTTNFTAVQQANPNDNKINLFGAPGDLYASSVVVSSPSGGSVTATELSEGTASVIGSQATAQFQIIIGTENIQANQTLTNDGTNIADGDTVTIGTKVYRFKTVMAQAYDVKRDAASNTISMTNLYLAINATGVVGTNYFAGTLVNTQVVATNPTGTTIKVIAIIGGTIGNAIVTTETSTHLLWGAATLTSGTDVNKISSVKVNGVELLVNKINWSVSNDATAIALVAEINNNSATSGYSAKQATGGLVYLTAVASTIATNTYVTAITSEGTCCISNCVFTITQNKTGVTFAITSISVDGTAITTGSTAWDTSLVQTVLDCVNNINANTATSGYHACAISNIIYISKNITSSTDPTSQVAVVVGAGGGVGTIGQAGMSVSTSVSATAFKGSVSGATDSSIPVKVNVSGGIPPYNYAWVAVDRDTGGINFTSQTGITPNNPASPSTTFHCSQKIQANGKFINNLTSLTRQFQCNVIDSAGTMSSTNTVSVTCTS